MTNGPLSSDTCMVIGPDGTPCSHKDLHNGRHSWDDEPTPIRAEKVIKIKTRLRVPTDEEFDGADFLESPALATLGQELIDSCWEFEHLHDLTVLFLWKRSGGKSKGKATLGKCQKPSGLLAHFAKADYVVTLSADHCRDLDMSPEQLEALVFHELCHTSVEEDEETGEVKVGTVGHDVEEFSAVIRRYGLWQPDVRNFAETVRQLKLDEATV